MFNGKTHYKWPFSIAMLNYQRVYAWMGKKTPEARMVLHSTTTPRSSGPSEETPAANGGVHNAPAHPEQNAKSVLQSH